MAVGGKNEQRERRALEPDLFARLRHRIPVAEMPSDTDGHATLPG
jgi:hypothetical protein